MGLCLVDGDEVFVVSGWEHRNFLTHAAGCKSGWELVDGGALVALNQLIVFDHHGNSLRVIYFNFLDHCTNIFNFNLIIIRLICRYFFHNDKIIFLWWLICLTFLNNLKHLLDLSVLIFLLSPIFLLSL